MDKKEHQKRIVSSSFKGEISLSYKNLKAMILADLQGEVFNVQLVKAEPSNENQRRGEA